MKPRAGQISVSTSGLLVVTHTDVQAAVADLDAAFGSPAFRSAGNAGLTGATAATRYVGATTSGAPASGTFLKGDFVIDQTGKVWICTTAGSPGTWTQVGGSSLTVQDENSNVSTAVTQIDFQGAGVTASSGSGEVIVTIPGETANPIQVSLIMPGTATVRDSNAVWIAPAACTITGIKAAVDSGTTTVVKLKKNGTLSGDATSGLTTTVATTTFGSPLSVSAGDEIRLSITTAGTGINVQTSLIGTIP